MFEEAISLLSIWPSMISWLTPTVLFLLLNLMIGTIAVTSGFTSHKPSHHHHHHTNHHEQPIFHQIHHQQQPQPQIQSYLSRSPSVLQRLKSINFSAFYSATTHHQQQPEPEPEPEQPNPPPSSADEGGDNGGGGGGGDEAPSMDEIYSRIKQGTSNSNYGRQNSDTKPSGGVMPDKLAKKMKKSATDMSAFNHFHIDERENNGATLLELEDDLDADVEEREYNAAVTTTAAMIKEEREDDGGVDAKADDFINNFRKQLLMQRKDSFLGYKDIITRTSAQ
ncbi:pathogen-associated molecular patterns-induced protein A70 [Beta vulgaris subsp. vulgaris]|uniref:pathogen-associated molecular patterns-induced protein A70 n=1 Tax=Beta vulgaris subsp. vulgaris TaxID=3555 RepID=UPI0020374A64|nr:pathogen-associated molecular patterns-induced protein A70 [Beta vulgaris subsp. vulgaris]